jgi:hypothetical protein
MYVLVFESENVKLFLEFFQFWFYIFCVAATALRYFISDVWILLFRVSFVVHVSQPYIKTFSLQKHYSGLLALFILLNISGSKLFCAFSIASRYLKFSDCFILLLCR